MARAPSTKRASSAIAKKKQLSLGAEADDGGALTCGVTPSGRIELRVDSAEAGPPMRAAVRARIIESFSVDRGRGVLQLGAGELDTELHPTLSYFRSLGQSLVSKACNLHDPNDPASLDIPQPELEELESLVRAVPPMRGGEFVTTAMLSELWADVGKALLELSVSNSGGLAGYLKELSPVWNVVGRVCLHLAENKRDPDHPFAFIATYVHRVSKRAAPQHRTLANALEEYAGARNRKKLVALLSPLSRAADRSELIQALIDSGEIYHPLPWTPGEAYKFLREIAIYEQAGLVVRLPDWWKRGKPPRPKVSVSVGARAPSKLGMDALLAFEVAMTLDGETLSEDEIARLRAATDGLVLVKGKWVQVDHDALTQTLDHWAAIQERVETGEVRFAEAMRMVAGTSLGESSHGSDEAAVPNWSEVVAGKWLASRLGELRSPAIRAEIDANAGLDAELRPYQKTGVAWLSTLRALELGGCLADDMGLGKTIQVLGLLSMTRKKREKGTDLLVVPASLMDNWCAEIERFSPQHKVLVAHSSHIPSTQLSKISKKRVGAHHLVITSYGTLMRTPWIKSYPWRDVILDEAQAIKNPGAKQTRAIKSLQSRWRLALTGTPVENRLGDLWSIFDFLNPGLLGSAKQFTALSKKMASDARGYASLKNLIEPYVLRRLKTDPEVISDLPDKVEFKTHCLLSKQQAVLYEQSVKEMRSALARLKGVERRGVVLAFLTRFKQICNHPSQWLGDHDYEPEHSGKLARLRELCVPIAARQEKVLVFTQYREMTGPLDSFLEGVFGRQGLVLHGGTPVKKRQGLVQRFQEDEGTPFMVLSLKAGGTGLNLTAASHVIHFDRWWNPAVENQATDRAFRIGQKRNVLVHKFVCKGTIEEHVDSLIESKQELADNVLSAGATSVLTEMSNEELLSAVSLDLARATSE